MSAAPKPVENSARERPLRGGLCGRGTASTRFFDAQEERWVIKVNPGEFYVTGESGEMIATVLGSCVAACIRDPQTGLGGLNHFMLPEEKASGWDGDAAALRYGTFAMERLVNELLRTGCPRARLEIKVFGGAVLHGSSVAIGTQNADFVLHYLKQEGLPVHTADLGGNQARRLNYHPVEGRVLRKFVTTLAEPDLVTSEKRYKRKIAATEADGEIELFDKNRHVKGEA